MLLLLVPPLALTGAHTGRNKYFRCEARIADCDPAALIVSLIAGIPSEALVVKERDRPKGYNAPEAQACL